MSYSSESDAIIQHRANQEAQYNQLVRLTPSEILPKVTIQERFAVAVVRTYGHEHYRTYEARMAIQHNPDYSYSVIQQLFEEKIRLHFPEEYQGLSSGNVSCWRQEYQALTECFAELSDFAVKFIEYAKEGNIEALKSLVEEILKASKYAAVPEARMLYDLMYLFPPATGNKNLLQWLNDKKQQDVLDYFYDIFPDICQEATQREIDMLTSCKMAIRCNKVDDVNQYFSKRDFQHYIDLKAYIRLFEIAANLNNIEMSKTILMTVRGKPSIVLKLIAYAVKVNHHNILTVITKLLNEYASDVGFSIYDLFKLKQSSNNPDTLIQLGILVATLLASNEDPFPDDYIAPVVGDLRSKFSSLNDTINQYHLETLARLLVTSANYKISDKSKQGALALLKVIAGIEAWSTLDNHREAFCNEPLSSIYQQQMQQRGLYLRTGDPIAASLGATSKVFSSTESHSTESSDTSSSDSEITEPRKKFQIFLDIDGVLLNPLDAPGGFKGGAKKHHIKQKNTTSKFSKDATTNLNTILDYIVSLGYEPEIIISSSWRIKAVIDNEPTLYSTEELQSLFQQHGFAEYISGRGCTMFIEPYRRNDEILRSRNQRLPFIAIDDLNLGPSLDGHFIHCDAKQLLNEDNCEHAKRLINDQIAPFTGARSELRATASCTI